MATGTDYEIEASADGRSRRSERSRATIVGAMLELVGEGTPAPTAQQVAERADVGVRTVFRHFSDMETLFAAMNDRLLREAAGLFVSEVQTGPVGDRIDALVTRRAKILGFFEPYHRADQALRSRSPFLQQQHRRSIDKLRADLERWLPEIKKLDADTRSALELALSFEAWERLRTDQRLGVRRAQNVLRRMTHALLSDLAR